MSIKNESGSFKIWGGLVIAVVVLLAIGAYKKNSAIEQFKKQCLSKGTSSAANCACLAGELDIRISVLHETPLIRHLIAPTNAELGQMVDSAAKSCM